ncbi:hypothetical protein RRG08_038614 [Elysia crispata]|uniref:Uncharacterized protein n=1 Tax=Elysia crispata TaxID=231223 RepID=A0AAE1D0H8_9GAST|nr:hypothetical protein RRG08_038614 [Elysia crispata]
MGVNLPRSLAIEVKTQALEQRGCSIQRVYKVIPCEGHQDLCCNSGGETKNIYQSKQTAQQTEPARKKINIYGWVLTLRIHSHFLQLIRWTGLGERRRHGGDTNLGPHAEDVRTSINLVGLPGSLARLLYLAYPVFCSSNEAPAYDRLVEGRPNLNTCGYVQNLSFEQSTVCESPVDMFRASVLNRVRCASHLWICSEPQF